jgi:N-acetylmuramoyl-L-alanine amidase
MTAGRLLSLLLPLLALAAACGDPPRPAVHIERPPASATPTAPAGSPPTSTAGGPERPTVFLDPGHGGRDPGWGASYILPGVPPEKDLNLDLARRTAAYLEAEGFRVVLSRTTDTDVNEPEQDLNGDGVMDIVDELQARADLANASGAVVLLSLHFNGMPGTGLGGASTWYNDKREFSDQNRRLATLIQEAQVMALTALGYPPRDWGALPDDVFETPTQAKLDTGYRHNTLIGPPGPFRTRPTRMPGAIAEPLFLTHPREAALAQDPAVRDALARAYARAVRRFLEEEHPDTDGR